MLTAYHCVAPQDETNLWGACPVEGEEHPTYVYRYGAPYHPSHFTFWPNQDAKAFDAMAVEIVVPSMEDPCGKDIAAIVLDRPLDSIPLATLREEPAAAGEVMTAVGFGAIDDAYSEPPYRLERNDMRVLAVGPALVPVPVQGDVSAGVPKGDLATTGGICFGDSGGPLLDADGKVVGVASRVASCAEGPAFYTGIAENLTFIAGARAAAKKALETPPDAGPSDAGRPRRDAGKKPDAAPPPEPPAQGDSGCSVSSNVRGSGPEGAAAAGALALAVLLARRARARAS